VFLDEPTGGVDPLSRRRFWRLIEQLAASGVAVLVTTHYLDEAEHCQRIAIIQAGKLAAHGTVDELKAIFKSRPILEVRAVDAVHAMRTLEGMPEVEKTSIFGTAVHAVMRSDAPGPDVMKARLQADGITVLSCSVVAPSLEDVFLDVAERSAA
jgi:ABC-2 type transport system ATP-binding protein